jgi:hypothetical protein
MKLFKIIRAAVLSVGLISGQVFADTTTTRFSMTKPDVGSASWGPKLNTNADIIDNAGGLALVNTWTNTNTFSGNTTFSAGTTVTVSTSATFSGSVAIGTVNKKKPLTVVEVVSTFTTVGANPVLWIGGGNGSNNSLSEIGFTYGFTGAYTETFAPATIGYQLISGSGLTKGDLTFATRNVTSDTQPTERMRITAAGQVQLAAGSAAAPTLDFTDTGTGFYKSGTDNIGMATAGSVRLNLTTTELRSVVNIVAAGGTNNLGSASDKWASGYITSLIGTTTNDNAATGAVGEFISTGSITLASQSGTGNYDNIVSTTLAAGDYTLAGACVWSESGLTVTRHFCVLSTNSGNTTTDQVVGYNEIPGAVDTLNSNGGGGTVPLFRVSINTPTTIYLKARSDYSGTAPTTKGFLTGRRTR